jgi:regulatory protein
MAMEKKIPKKITKSYLHNAALYYLQRYATSAANLRRVLMRKVKKSCAHHGQNEAECVPLVDELIERFAATGLIDDAVYARGRAESLRRQGRSKQAIHAKLQVKGLKKTQIDEALAIVDLEEDAELRAALHLARKKKLGPWRVKDADPKKEMAAMGRAGFSFDVARKVLAYEADGD